MPRLFQVVAILGLVVFFWTFVANVDEEKFVSHKLRNKGVEMLQHRPWYSGKRSDNIFFDKVRSSVRIYKDHCFKVKND